MTDAIEAGARAIAELRGALWTRDRNKPISGTYDYDAAKACIEAAIASGALVPASADLSAQLTDMRDHIDHIEGGLQLLLAAAKAGDPHKEIIWRVEEELRQIERLRQLDTAPASGDYVVVPAKPIGWFNPWDDYHGFQQVAEEFEGTRDTIPLYADQKAHDDLKAAMLNAASRTGDQS